MQILPRYLELGCESSAIGLPASSVQVIVLLEVPPTIHLRSPEGIIIEPLSGCIGAELFPEQEMFVMRMDFPSAWPKSKLNVPVPFTTLNE